MFVEEEDELTFDHHGRDIKFPFKINSKTIENYPKRLLEKNESNVKKPSELTYDAAIKNFNLQLKKPLDERTDVRNLMMNLYLREITKSIFQSLRQD